MARKSSLVAGASTILIPEAIESTVVLAQSSGKYLAATVEGRRQSKRSLVSKMKMEYITDYKKEKKNWAGDSDDDDDDDEDEDEDEDGDDDDDDVVVVVDDDYDDDDDDNDDDDDDDDDDNNGRESDYSSLCSNLRCSVLVVVQCMAIAHTPTRTLAYILTSVRSRQMTVKPRVYVIRGTMDHRATPPMKKCCTSKARAPL
jgi:hypothetical protein